MSISEEAISSIASLVTEIAVQGVSMIASAAHASEEDAVAIQQKLEDALAALQGVADETGAEHAALTSETEQIISAETKALGTP